MNRHVHKIFKALGTVNTIHVPACHDEQIVNAAAERVHQLHRLFSAFEKDSDVSRVNDMAGRDFVPVHPDTVYLLEQAKLYSEATNGAFDVSILPLVKLWQQFGKTSSLPPERDIRRNKKLVCSNDILIDKENSAVKLRKKGQSVDLGGIAKGYAVDEVRRILTENGVSDAVVNLGGSVAVLGHERPVGIQHPDKNTGTAFGQVYLKNTCAVTSGSYEKFFTIGAERYHHIIDPRTGRPSQSGVLGVTLIGEDAMALDALSTAVFVLGARQGSALAEHIGAESIVVDDKRNVYVSKAINHKFEFNSLSAV